jgi:hypothetical protein
VNPRAVQERLDAAGGLTALEEAVGSPAATWGGRCHEISLAVLKSGLLGPGRVARGTARGVTSQHSWIVLGDAERPDPYSEKSVIADPTIFSYEGRDPYVLVKQNLMHAHWPHGAGDIWTHGGLPPEPTGKLIELEGYEDLPEMAKRFLELCGYPLDYRGWAHLVHGPVQGWPAGEVITAMCATRELAVITPIDIIGMTTELNPKELYW